MQNDKNTIGYKIGYYLLGPLVMLAVTASSIRLIAWAVTGQ